jgi:hypothetical protein
VHGPSVAHPGLPIMNTSRSVVLAGLVVALFVSLQACTDAAVTEPDPLSPGGGADLTVIGEDSVVLGAPVTVTAKLVDGRGNPMGGRTVYWRVTHWRYSPPLSVERDLGTTATDAGGMTAIELVPPVLGYNKIVAAFKDISVTHDVQTTAPTTPHPTLRWEPVTPMPSRRAGQRAVTLDGLIYLVGGYCSYSPLASPRGPMSGPFHVHL